MKTAWINMWKLAMLFQCSCLAWRCACPCEKELQNILINPMWSVIEVWLISRKNNAVFFSCSCEKQTKKPNPNFNSRWCIISSLLLLKNSFSQVLTCAFWWRYVTIPVIAKPGRRVSITLVLLLQFGSIFQGSLSAITEENNKTKKIFCKSCFYKEH